MKPKFKPTRRWLAAELLFSLGAALEHVKHELLRLHTHPGWRDIWTEKELEYLKARHKELDNTQALLRGFRERRCK